ncbi:GNAT family N-acetyltransferase [Planococcus shenhongbingii]|uniref:GNAT family N-acetyltransferase n=1 Tax=Planococcus shenhongbingii TaxID=3058398 RepID=UPI00261F2BC2|nr:GNAT family N-acetyltransferase [Planococcus sp. N016]WKA59038.1 GNAT family N-acetyltransferase [Planococcus sp. N016]
MTIILEKKYIPLADYFASASSSKITLSFNEIEQIMGQQLPNAAYLNKSWWKKTKPPAKHFHAWMDAGYHVSEIITNRYVTFERTDASGAPNANAGNEDILLIRAAEHGDARSLVTLQRQVESESDFMLYGKDERIQSTQSMRKQIIDWKQKSHSTIFIAILNGEHVGYLMIIGNAAKRAAHRAELVLGVQKSAQNKGIATSLLQRAEEWSATKGVTRLELTVVEENTAARKLYDKSGYEKEGIRKKSLIIDDKPYDEIYMAKFLD